MTELRWRMCMIGHGSSLAVYAPWLVIHVVVIVTGLYGLRRARQA